MEREKAELIKKTYFTVLYLNCLNCPPTTFEIWRHFLDISRNSKQIVFREIVESLEILRKKSRITNRTGFWVIKNKEFLATQRIVRQKTSLNKIKNLQKWVKLIKYLPFIRGVFVAGTLAFQTSSKDSDWDVLIIMKKNRIWLGRLILTAFLFIFNKKRTQTKIKNKFCLNHFLTENNLIPQIRNEYTASEYGFIFPILGEKLFNDFIRLNWNWLRRFSANFEVGNDFKGGFLVGERKARKIRNLLERFLEFLGIAKILDQICKKWMIKRIEKNPRTFKNEAVVIYNDGELAFWPDFKGKDILKKAVNFSN